MKWVGRVSLTRSAGVVASCPACRGQPHDRADGAYQQAGALELLHPANGVRLPPVYSGHNGFWYWGPPPDFATDAVVVGDFSPELLSTSYARCEVRSTVTSPAGVSNDLTGIPVRWCTGRLRPWSELWPEFQRLA